MSGATTLLRHAWARHRLPLMLIAAAVGGFQFLLTRIAPALNEVGLIGALIPRLPVEVRRLLGNEIALTPGGFLAFGYGHPFVILLLSVWVVRVSSAAVAGEVGRGTMDILACRPVPRWHFLAAGMTTTALGLAAILAIAWLGTAAGLRMRPLNVLAFDFWRVVVAAWLLFVAWGGVGLAVSATRRDAGQAIAWTTGIIASSFVLDYLARLWMPIARLRPLSLFRYYEPQAILMSGLSTRLVLVMASTTILGLAGALLAIQRRDL